MNLLGLFFCALGSALLALWGWLEYPRAIHPLDPPGSYEWVARISAGRSFVLMSTGFTLLFSGFFLILLSRSPLPGWFLLGAAGYFSRRYWRRASSRRRWEIRRSWELWIGNWRKIFRGSSGLSCYYCGHPAQMGRLLVKADSTHQMMDLYVGHPACLERWEDGLRDAAQGLEVAVTEEVPRITQPDGMEHLERLLQRAQVRQGNGPAQLVSERLQMLRMELESRHR